MNLYLISQDQNCGYDTYDSAVVAAESEAEARMTHPSDYVRDWDGTARPYDSWCAAVHVEAELIGTATEGTPAGVVCASFNAG